MIDEDEHNEEVAKMRKIHSGSKLRQLTIIVYFARTFESHFLQQFLFKPFFIVTFLLSNTGRE